MPVSMEERGFIANRRGKRLFYALHAAVDPDSLWVFCNPFLEEKVFSHSVYVEFARFLASHGHAVVRFDYEGDGDSEGDILETDVDCRVNDAGDIVQALRPRFNDLSVNFFGLRFGAIVAARATGSIGARGMLLWDPVLNGERYFDECLKINLTTQLSTYKKVTEDRKQMVTRLQNGGTVNISGYEVGRRMYESLVSVRLQQIVRPETQDVSVVAINRPGSANTHAAAAALAGNHAQRFRICECLQFWYEPRFINAHQDELFATSLELITDRTAPVT